ncbi:HAD family hydrolase [Micromonospora sp. KC606]|uniref:HAD family hydrolase n=1 Tax=Micromonospora sp. KC606 TaxID=2530379 RepID=UPI00104B30FA|nr:HAD family hydrolase [Micromonospora sp. KC606]TDC85515.1 HAD family hydrolase [Micromonospora sp. KC606]
MSANCDPPGSAATADEGRPPGPGLAPPRALLVDLDDTLLDGAHTALAVDGTCAALASSLTGPRPQQRLREAYAEVWAAHRPEVELPCWLGRMDGVAAIRETWRRVLSHVGVVEERATEFAVRRYQSISRSAYRPFPDVADLLATTTRLRVPVVLVTNGPSDVQRDKLGTLGFGSAFDAVAISGEIGSAKPDPALFAAALDLVGADPRDAWHVGDGLTNDVGGARAAGVVAVWLNRTGRPSPTDHRRPDVEVTSLAQLSALLLGKAAVS